MKTSFNLWMIAVCLVAACLTFTPSSLAQSQTGSSPSKKSASSDDQPTRVLASVGDSLITVADVDLELGRTASSRNDLPPVPEPVLMAAVDIIAQRRQALESLRKSKKRVPDAAIDKWLLENSPAELKLSAAQALAARAEAANISPQNYRDFLAFRLSWPAYLQAALTDANLEKHFKNQKARFDGTRFEVEHVWIGVPPGASRAREAAHESLAAVRKRLVDGSLKVPEAAKELLSSQATEADQQDALKSAEPLWLTGSGPLMPKIIDQVLKTPAGQFTEPFDSASAVHLVHVIKIEPGSRSFDQAKDDVRKHTLVYLLDYLAQKSAKEMPLRWQAK